MSATSGSADRQVVIGRGVRMPDMTALMAGLENIAFEGHTT
jgi:hypothetical protein